VAALCCWSNEVPGRLFRWKLDLDFPILENSVIHSNFDKTEKEFVVFQFQQNTSQQQKVPGQQEMAGFQKVLTAI
jgi:hypothetical protein